MSTSLKSSHFLEKNRSVSRPLRPVHPAVQGFARAHRELRENVFALLAPPNKVKSLLLGDLCELCERHDMVSYLFSFCLSRLKI